jgi:signal transduction histidine kinase
MTSALGQLTSGTRVQDGPKREGGDIRECIEQARHEIWPRAADRGIEVSINLRPPRQTLLFDREQVSQVLVNLLENACKFMPKRGHIEISGYPYFWERRSNRTPSPVGLERRTQNCRIDNSFRIDVSNTGPAIMSESMNRFFQDPALYGSVYRSPGSGLGLAICKRIVKQHCGRIWAEDGAEGPQVSFVLPFEPRPHAIIEGAGVGDYYLNGNDF